MSFEGDGVADAQVAGGLHCPKHRCECEVECWCKHKVQVQVRMEGAGQEAWQIGVASGVDWCMHCSRALILDLPGPVTDHEACSKEQWQWSPFDMAGKMGDVGGRVN